MSHTNPYAGSWGSNGWPSMGSMPPTYGALPYMENIPSAILFNFVMANNSSVLNCSVYGTNNSVYFTIQSNTVSTTVTRRNGEVFAVINWPRHATIQASGILELQRTGQWLRLSRDKLRRTMSVNGRSYTWHPRGSAICLYGDDTSASGELARITRTNAGVTLQITMQAYNSGFFETSVLATILFLSGRDID